MRICFASSVIISLVLVLDDGVAGICQSSFNNALVDTDWASCFVADKSGNCPHGLLKLGEKSCTISSTATRNQKPQKRRVCCLLPPVMSLKIQNAPCLATGKANDEHDNN